MIKKRFRQPELKDPERFYNYTLRATGITNYLSHPNAKLERAQNMANHTDPKTALLYNRRDEDITPDEVEEITI